MPRNIKEIKVWEDNPDKSRLSNVVKVEFNFPCTWTVFHIADLEKLIREWIRGEEMKYPLDQDVGLHRGKLRGRWMLKEVIDKIFNEVNEMDMKKYADLWVDPKALASTGDFAVILDEGEERTSTFGTRTVTRPVFMVEHNFEKKYLSLNKSNVRELMKEYGEDSKAWLGKVILLVPINVQVGRETKIGIMAKPHRGPIPQQPTPVERVL